MTETQIAARQGRINAARAILDFLEANPTVKLPFNIGSEDFWGIYNLERDEAISLLKALPADGLETANGNDNDVIITRRFGALGIRGYVPLNNIGDYTPLVEKAKEQLFNEFVAEAAGEAK